MRRQREEIAAEVAALRALKPVGQFARKTADTIAAQIDALENGVDETCDEWDDLSEEEQVAMREADEWADDFTDDKPSEGYGTLVSGPAAAGHES